MNNILKSFFITLAILVFSAAFYNYKTDNFTVFNRKYDCVYNPSVLPNEAFLKRRHFFYAFEKYKNFLFGASNALNVSTFSIPRKNCYSFADNYQTPYDIYYLMVEITDLKKDNPGYNPESFVVFYEPEYLYLSENMSDKMKNEYANMQEPPDFWGKVGFYLKYLYKNPFEKRVKNFTYKQKLNFFTDGSFVSHLDERADFVYENHFEKNINLKENKIEDNLKIIGKIKKLCVENDIELFFVLTPQSSRKLALFDEKDLKYFKKELSCITSFYDFWIDDEFSKNSENFDENGFITPKTGEKLIEKLFYGKNGFGKFVSEVKCKNEK